MSDEDFLATTEHFLTAAGVCSPSAADASRFATLYACHDPVRVAALLLLRAELEHRVYLQRTDAYREDIVQRYAHSPSVLLRPYVDLLELLSTGRAFGALRSWAHQIAMHDVAHAVRQRVDGVEDAIRDCMDTLLGELVDRYGDDADFYSLVRDSPADVRSRVSYTPGTTALFDAPRCTSVPREDRTLVQWMRERSD